MNHRHVVLLSVLAMVTFAAPASASTVIGTGRSPNVAVGPTGTAYVAWNGLENVRTLHFCRAQRLTGAGCDTTTTITTPGTTESRPFVTFDRGGRVVVVEHRYGGDVPGFDATYAYTSQDDGVTFGPGQVIGRVPIDEAIGFSTSILGISNAFTEGAVFQESPLDPPGSVDQDGRSTVGSANLSGDHPYGSSIGATFEAVNAQNDFHVTLPLAVFADKDGAYEFRRYTGVGSLNDVANWTPAAGVGTYLNAKLLSGSSGLFLIAATPKGFVVARKWTESARAFGPPTTIGAGDWPTIHGVEDPYGRLHVVFRRRDGAGLHLVHAVSTDGLSWRQGVVESQTSVAEGDLVFPRLSVAADHIGWVVWTATGANEIRLARVGPSAPRDFGEPQTEGFAQPRVVRAGGALAIVSRSQSLRTLKQKGLTVRLQDGAAGKVTLKVAALRPGHPPAPIRTLSTTFAEPGSKNLRVSLKGAIIFQRGVIIFQRGLRVTLIAHGKSSAVNLNLKR